MCCLRFLREFEKWSWLGKIGKNEEKWSKKTAPESPNIHYYQVFITKKALIARNIFNPHRNHFLNVKETYVWTRKSSAT